MTSGKPSEKAVLEAIDILNSMEPCTCQTRQIYVAGQVHTIQPTTTYENCKCCNSQETRND